MIEKILGLSTGVTLTDLGALAALTSIIVQVAKQLLPKKVPTQFVTIIVSLVLSLSSAFVYFSNPLKAAGIGLVMGFVSAFTAMNGYDALKNIWTRFTVPDSEDQVNEDTEAEVEEDNSFGGEE